MKEIHTHPRLKHYQERIASGLIGVWVKGLVEESALPNPSHSQVQIQRREKLQQVINAEIK